MLLLNLTKRLEMICTRKYHFLPAITLSQIRFLSAYFLWREDLVVVKQARTNAVQSP